jgi:hypothetical protein
MTPVARSSSIVALGEIPPSLLFLYLPSACVLPGDLKFLIYTLHDIHLSLDWQLDDAPSIDMIYNLRSRLPLAIYSSAERNVL